MFDQMSSAFLLFEFFTWLRVVCDMLKLVVDDV